MGFAQKVALAQKSRFSAIGYTPSNYPCNLIYVGVPFNGMASASAVPSPSPLYCAERNRRLRIYVDAVAKVNEAGEAFANLQSPETRDATTYARAVCQEALVAFSQHRREHGC